MSFLNIFKPWMTVENAFNDESMNDAVTAPVILDAEPQCFTNVRSARANT